MVAWNETIYVYIKYIYNMFDFIIAHFHFIFLDLVPVSSSSCWVHTSPLYYPVPMASGDPSFSPSLVKWPPCSHTLKTVYKHT